MPHKKSLLKLSVFINCGKPENKRALERGILDRPEIAQVYSESRADVVFSDRKKLLIPDPVTNRNTWYYYIAKHDGKVPIFLVNFWIYWEDEIADPDFLNWVLGQLIEQKRRSVKNF